MLDAVLYNRKLAEDRSASWNSWDLKRQYLLITLHRAENTDDPRRMKSMLKPSTNCPFRGPSHAPEDEKPAEADGTLPSNPMVK